MTKKWFETTQKTGIIATVLLLAMLIAVSCGDEDNSPPEYGDNKSNNDDWDTSVDGNGTTGRFTGLDLLLVVDNSGSMYEEQQILSTGLFTLVNKLTNPVDAEAPAIEEMRVGVVTTDMGLQWGETETGGNTGGNTTDVAGCDDKGDNARLMGMQATIISVQDDQIPCTEDGGQCPDGFECNAGFCEASSGVNDVNCLDINLWEERDPTSPIGFAAQAACMAAQGTDGCGVEQQLQAADRGLMTTPEFMVETHKLAVLVVSDEEDCSIASKDLFQTDEWRTGANELLNVACNYPSENEEYLIPVDTYREKLLEHKGGDPDAVVFGAIVGVPTGASSPCEGTGDEIAQNDCLDDYNMEIEIETFEVPELGSEYHHFAPACTRDEEGLEVTAARPGRRYVKVAESFGANGLVYSICNEDWTEAMEAFADIAIAKIKVASTMEVTEDPDTEW